MNRWAARLLGVILLVVFALMFAQIYRTLVRLQQQQAPATTPSR
jgi:hypothetical protein